MFKVLLSIIFMLGAGGAMAQMSVEDAFRNENAQAFDQHFHEQVEMYISGKDSRYKKADAVALMKTFFASYEVKSFKEVHSGSSRGKDSNYYIGQLTTDKGVFRVYIYYDVHDNKRDIHELRIENN